MAADLDAPRPPPLRPQLDELGHRPRRDLSDATIEELFTTSFTSSQVTREDPLLPPSDASAASVPASPSSARLVVLHQLLHSSECVGLIQATESLGYENIEWEYTSDYRDCDRLVLHSEQLASLLWSRVLPHLHQHDVSGLRPYGFGTRGTWVPVGINPCFRFSRYARGGKFEPHRDGNFCVTDDERSVYSLIVYLNEEFEGGETFFYPGASLEEKLRARASWETSREFRQMVDRGEVQPATGLPEPDVALFPRTGSAVLFNHDCVHAGRPVTGGPKAKYIVRSDVLFRRVSHRPLRSLGTPGSPADLVEYSEHPDYQEVMRAFDRSIELQQAGDAAGSTAAYLHALEMQARLPSVPAPAEQAPGKEAHWVPSAIWNEIFSFLELHDVLSGFGCVSRGWCHVSRLPLMWERMYKRRWGNDHALLSLAWRQAAAASAAAGASEEEQKSTASLVENWFLRYRERLQLERKFQTLFIDFGGMGVKFGLVGQSDRVASMLAEHAESADPGWHHSVGKPVLQRPLDADGAVVLEPIHPVVGHVSGHYWAAFSGVMEHLVGQELFRSYYRLYTTRTLYANPSARVVAPLQHLVERLIGTDSPYYREECASFLLPDRLASSLGASAARQFKDDPERLAEELAGLDLLAAVIITRWIEGKGVGFVPPREHPLMVAVPFGMTGQACEVLAGALFAAIETPYIALVPESVLALIAVRRHSGLVISAGELRTSIVPVFHAVVFDDEARAFARSGRDVDPPTEANAAAAFLDGEHDLVANVCDTLMAIADDDVFAQVARTVVLSGGTSVLLEGRLRDALPSAIAGLGRAGLTSPGDIEVVAHGATFEERRYDVAHGASSLATHVRARELFFDSEGHFSAPLIRDAAPPSKHANWNRAKGLQWPGNGHRWEREYHPPVRTNVVPGVMNHWLRSTHAAQQRARVADALFAPYVSAEGAEEDEVPAPSLPDKKRNRCVIS